MTVGTVCLCLLFFPTLNYSYFSEQAQTERKEREMQIEFKCHYQIQPVLGPQKIFLSIEIILESKSFKIDFKSDDKRNSVFCWNARRKAFYGRINGAQLWKRRNSLHLEESEPTKFSHHKILLKSVDLELASSPLVGVLSGKGSIEFGEVGCHIKQEYVYTNGTNIRVKGLNI